MTEKVSASIIYYLILYLFSQWISQWLIEFKGVLPFERNYVNNFVNSLVLMCLVFYISNPQIVLEKWSLVIGLGAFIIAMMYSITKITLEEETEREKVNEINKKHQIINWISLIFYGLIAIVFLIVYTSKLVFDGENWKMVLIYIFAVGLYMFLCSIPYIRNNSYQINFTLGLYLYPLLFLSSNTIYNYHLNYLYTFLFVSVSVLFGFFGVQYFIKPKDEMKRSINMKSCKTLLGMDDKSINEKLNRPNEQKESEMNSRNIKIIYVFLTILIISILLSLGLVYKFVS